jgi:hypothetical protein
MVYAGEGWLSWGDWLGTGRIASYKNKWRDFAEVRAFARSLGLKSREEWLAFARSERRPADLPTKPWRTYAKEGWAGMGGWLGTGRIAPQLRKFPRAFARKLGLKSAKQWRSYSKSGDCPPDIPSNPNREYAKRGWISWSDWLDTGNTATNSRKPRSFEEARAYARSLGLTSANEWRAYSKLGKLREIFPLEQIGLMQTKVG